MPAGFPTLCVSLRHVRAVMALCQMTAITPDGELLFLFVPARDRGES